MVVALRVVNVQTVTVQDKKALLLMIKKDANAQVAIVKERMEDVLSATVSLVTVKRAEKVIDVKLVQTLASSIKVEAGVVG